MIFKTIWGGDHARMFQELRILIILKLFKSDIIHNNNNVSIIYHPKHFHYSCIIGLVAQV